MSRKIPWLVNHQSQCSVPPSLSGVSLTQNLNPDPLRRTLFPKAGAPMIMYQGR